MRKRKEPTDFIVPKDPPAIRDRIRELRRVKASDIEPNPDNWRAHPPKQQAALAAMLASIGFADAAIAFEPDPENAPGRLRLIDGHLRTDLAGDAEIPVLVLDVTEAEARQLLLSIDPLAAMAASDREKLAALLETTPLPDGADELLATLTHQLTELEAELETVADELADEEPEEVEIPEGFQVVIACPDEETQQRLYEELAARGFDCKLLSS